MLCYICLGAFMSVGPIPMPSWSSGEEDSSISWVPHHQSFWSLRASAEKNCAICTKFLALFPEEYVKSFAQSEGFWSTHDASLSANRSGGVPKKGIPRGTKIGAIPYFASFGKSYELRVAGYGLQSHSWDWWGKVGGQRIGINLRLEGITKQYPGPQAHLAMLENEWLMVY